MKKWAELSDVVRLEVNHLFESITVESSSCQMHALYIPHAFANFNKFVSRFL